MIRAIFFDVGETLINEHRLWTAWADYLRIPTDSLFAALDKCIHERLHHRELFQFLRPGFDVDAARSARAAAGDPDLPNEADLYLDAVPCIRALRQHNVMIGIAANQPAQAVALLSSLGVIADKVASSEEWGVEKPSRVFFDRICNLAALPPSQLAYVGDRVDNDVLPALNAGMYAIFLRRGPWARIQAKWPEARLASLTVDSLSELIPALAGKLG